MGNKFGLLGERLGHSFSPQIHRKFGNYEYTLYEKNEDELDGFFGDSTIKGFNITIPYKKVAMKYCDKISENAKKIGSINTVTRDVNGKLHGYNTDYDGFLYMLEKGKLELKNKKVAILGTGGASLTADVVARELGAREVIKISRDGNITYDNKEKYIDSDILINCTPVGMYPNNLKTVVDLKEFSKLEGVADCIYNPRRTSLLLQAEELGIKNIDGLPMLLAQGKKASEYFQDRKIDNDILDTALMSLRKEFENIIIVGMPGSGKTSIARQLSKNMNIKYYDTDKEIEKNYNIKIPDYIEENGEEAFRDLESKIIEELGKKTGIIIATGGGAILRKKNYYPLKQNGTIFFVERELANLATKGRPLSKGGIERLEELYKIRKPKYDFFSDYTIKNTNFKDTISTIEELYYESLGN